MKKLYSENEQFFNKIDTEAKAYVLGFFFADGCNHDLSNLDDGYYHQNVISFTQLEQDIDILDQIKLVMKCNRPYVEITQKTNGKKKYSLRITSDTLSNALSRLGAVPNKSLTLKFPTTKQVPEKLMPHFIRGYFDGDGGCTLNTSKSKVQKRVYIYSASYSLLCEFEFYMKKVGIKFNNIVKSGKNILIYKSVPSTISYKDYFNFLYKDATIYLQRKKNKFEDILRTNFFIQKDSLPCKFCGSLNTICDGYNYYKVKRQNYLCKDCKRHFTAPLNSNI